MRTYAKKWSVKSSTSDKTYTVSVTEADEWGCGCPWWINQRAPKPHCKHIREIRTREGLQAASPTPSLPRPRPRAATSVATNVPKATPPAVPVAAPRKRRPGLRDLFPRAGKVPPLHGPEPATASDDRARALFAALTKD